MSQPLDPQIKEQFLSLPKAVQDVITDSGWQFTIRDIIKKFNLRIDQGGVIEQEVMFVMFGFEDAEVFLENIMREGKLDEKTAIALEAEVANVIFAPLKKALMQSLENSETMQTQKQPPLRPIEKIESRDDLLKQIEDPSEIAVPEIKIPAQVPPPTAVSAPQSPTANPAPIKPSTDPYREPIE